MTSINSMMDPLLMQSAQLFLKAAQYFVNGVNVLFPNTVADIIVLFLNVGIGQIPYVPEIVCVLMVAFLLFAAYQVCRCFLKTLKFFLRTLKVIVGTLCQLLYVFCRGNFLEFFSLYSSSSIPTY